jgi:hypothetical protein
MHRSCADLWGMNPGVTHRQFGQLTASPFRVGPCGRGRSRRRCASPSHPDRRRRGPAGRDAGRARVANVQRPPIRWCGARRCRSASATLVSQDLRQRVNSASVKRRLVGVGVGRPGCAGRRRWPGAASAPGGPQPGSCLHSACAGNRGRVQGRGLGDGDGVQGGVELAVAARLSRWRYWLPLEASRDAVAV